MAWSRRQIYLRGTGAGALARGIELASGLAIVWLSTRALSTESYGDLVLALTVVELVTLLASGGLESLVLYRTSRSEAPPGELDGAEFAGNALGWGLLIGGLAGAGLWLGASGLAAVFDKPELGFWLRALAWLLPIGVGRLVYAAWHRARQRIPQSVLLGHALPRLATALALAAVVGLAPTREAIAASFVAAPLLVLIPWFLRHPLDPARLRDGISAWDAGYALRLSFTGLLQRGVNQGDILLLGLLASSTATAEYAVASRLAVVTSAAFSLFIPTFAARVGYLLSRDQERDLEREYDEIRRLALLAALLTVVPIGLAGSELLGLFGRFEGALPPLLILSAAWLAQASFGTNRAYLSFAGYPGWTLAVTALLVGVNLGLDLLLIPLWGGSGAAIATFVAVVGSRALTSAAIWRLRRFRTYSPGLALLTGSAVALLLLAAAGLLGALPTGLGLAALTAFHVAQQRRRWTALLGGLLDELRRLRSAR
jgi:O-antigen/teichoic acid export membrane protein